MQDKPNLCFFFLFLRIGTSKGITGYCFEHAHEGCTIVSVGRRRKADQSVKPNSVHFQGNSVLRNNVTKYKLQWMTSPLNTVTCIFSPVDNKQPNSRRFKKEKQCDKGVSPVLEDYIKGIKAQNRSPRTVLNSLEGQSNSTEDDTFSTRVSSTTYTPSLDSKIKSRSKIKPQFSFRFIVSFLASPFRRKNFNIYESENRQPLLKCFIYEQIFNATNDFHQGMLLWTLDFFQNYF